MEKQASIINDVWPRVWVECLASYNSGESVGRWVNVPETVEEMQEEINQVLSMSSEPDAEEWAFHDNEGFDPFEIGEYESLESLVKKACVINQVDNIEAFEAWDYDHLDLDKLSVDEIIESFEEEFLGVFEDEEDYAYHVMSECEIIPEHLAYYIDYSAYWRDLRDGGYYAHHAGYKECYIYKYE